jgi:hypothetical protein
VIIEITENQPTFDFEGCARAAALPRRVKIAIDDLGEGFSSLRLWSELRPEFIKVDMHFVQGVDRDPIKLQFLKSIQHIAESCGTHVIAEGVETEAELRVVKDIGIAFGQGYFIARPSPTPPLLASAETGSIINSSNIAIFPMAELNQRSQMTASKLLTYVEPVLPETLNDHVFERFNTNPALRIIPVVKGGKPLGIINRYASTVCQAVPARTVWQEALHESSIAFCRWSRNMPIEELSHFCRSRQPSFLRRLHHHRNGRYIGISRQDLLV